MKKNILKILFIGILSFVFTLNAKAVSISKDDIPDDSYVIGEFLFTRDANETNNYGGVLTTPEIMLASHSIMSGSLEDMIIYYKDIFGEWMDGLTGEEVDVPSSFEISNRNLKDMLVKPELKCRFTYDSMECTSSFQEEDKTLIYDELKATNPRNTLGDKYGVEYYLLTDSDGSTTTFDIAKEIEGTFKGYSEGSSSSITLTPQEFVYANHTYNKDNFYNIVCRYYYMDGTEKVYSDYSEIASNGAFVKLGFEPVGAYLRGYKTTNLGVQVQDNGDADITYYNIKFKGSSNDIDTTKYLIKNIRMYGRSSAFESYAGNISAINNAEGGNNTYKYLWANKIVDEKFTKVHRFGGEYQNSYLIAEISGDSALVDVYNDVSNTYFYSNKIEKYTETNNSAYYFPELEVCNLDATLCYTMSTEGFVIELF